MQLSFRDYRKAARRERVIIALALVLQSIDKPARTIDVATRIGALLGTRDTKEVGRILTSLAPGIPEAHQTGESFVLYGRRMQRWEWYPKGQTAKGATRAAVRQARAAPMEPEMPDWDAEHGETWQAYCERNGFDENGKPLASEVWSAD